MQISNLFNEIIWIISSNCVAVIVIHKCKNFQFPEVNGSITIITLYEYQLSFLQFVLLGDVAAEVPITSVQVVGMYEAVAWSETFQKSALNEQDRSDDVLHGRQLFKIWLISRKTMKTSLLSHRITGSSSIC